jgi:hypothetical protein
VASARRVSSSSMGWSRTARWPRGPARRCSARADLVERHRHVARVEEPEQRLGRRAVEPCTHVGAGAQRRRSLPGELGGRSRPSLRCPPSSTERKWFQPPPSSTESWLVARSSRYREAIPWLAARSCRVHRVGGGCGVGDVSRGDEPRPEARSPRVRASSAGRYSTRGLSKGPRCCPGTRPPDGCFDLLPVTYAAIPGDESVMAASSDEVMTRPVIGSVSIASGAFGLPCVKPARHETRGRPVGEAHAVAEEEDDVLCDARARTRGLPRNPVQRDLRARAIGGLGHHCVRSFARARDRARGSWWCAKAPRPQAARAVSGVPVPPKPRSPFAPGAKNVARGDVGPVERDAQAGWWSPAFQRWPRHGCRNAGPRPALRRQAA